MAARTCIGVAVVGKKKDAPTNSFSHCIKYSTPQRVSTLRSSASLGTGLGTGFGLDCVLVFALRERRFVDANYVSIKDVAAHCNTAKPPYGSCTNSSWV